MAVLCDHGLFSFREDGCVMLGNRDGYGDQHNVGWPFPDGTYKDFVKDAVAQGAFR